MKISLNSSPINKILCEIDNFKLKIVHQKWNDGKHHRCVCHVCGDILDSWEDPYSPEECGWKRLKENIYHPWICHTCLEHHSSFWQKKASL